MLDFEKPQHKGIWESAKDLVTSPVLGEEISEFRAAGDRAEEMHHAAPLFGNQATGSFMASVGGSSAVKVGSDLLAPIGGFNSASEMSKGIEEGNVGEAVHGGLGAFTSGLGTAGALGDAAQWAGAAMRGTSVGSRLASAGETLATGVGSKSLLGPIGAVVSSGMAGWDTGNEFNKLTQESGEYGENSDGTKRSFSDMAGDDGFAADQAVEDAIDRKSHPALASPSGTWSGRGNGPRRIAAWNSRGRATGPGPRSVESGDCGCIGR